MDLFSKCKALYEKIRYFEYGIPVDGVIKPVPSAEYFVKNYHFLKPEEFEKYKGGICWDYVEYERKCLEVNDIDFNQYYIITNTPPNYDTHTFVTVKDGDDLIYIESSFKRVEHIIDGVQKFKSLEDIVKLITTNMWYCNDNDKHFDEFKYDVCKFKGHPQYGCTCEEYMKWMDDNSDIVIQDVSINPKKINEDELPVEEFSVNKIDTKFTQFVCESVNDPEEYDETLHDHIADEDDVYNESWTDFKNGVHPSSNLMFHVSLKNDMDGKTITPQLPSYITDGGELDDNYQEDTKTKRLCVSPSIEGCLIAILNYKKIREHVGDKFYVYTPEKPFSQYKHKTNKEIVKDKLVFDANITKEAWILEPCKLKLYGIIKLKKVKDLKKKPTVEKGIKMNTIKLDYEWIMTPKASGKFNKAIGDSPNDESDNKEKPIKEYDNILVSNDEFFMEVSKYERRLNKQFQREYEKNPKRAKYDYVGNEKRPRNSDKYTRERINRVTQQRKDYEKASNIKNSSVKTRNSSNKNKLKALKLLDYDPKTNTIKGNITLPDGSKKKRVPYIIENEVARNMGPFVGTIDEVRSMFDSIDFTNDKKPSSTELSRRQKVLNTLDQFEKNGEKFVIVIPRKFLNQRHLAGAGASLHELGHFTYIHDPNQSEETERAKTFRDSIKDKLTENTPSYMHLVKNPMGDISATYGIDESNEFSADKYAADRIGIKNYERMLKKLIKFGKKATNKAVISQINATETQLNLLKSSNGDSNYKEILNYIKGSAETFSRWSNEAQESVVQYKSKIKDLDKNIADINRKINEFKDHTSEISDELKELYKALESAKDERESAVEELKSKRESAKSNTDSADKLFNNASFAAQYKALKSSINNFKKWMDDYDVELNERINYIKKYHEKKNIGESCLIMDNDEFFGLTE
jgi:archaellum component FlaC